MMASPAMPAPLLLAFALALFAAPAASQVVVPAPRPPTPGDQAQELKGSGAIRGQITAAETGKPLRRAQVQLTAEFDYLSPPRTASTSSDGRYEFRDVPRGRYTLRVQRSGYIALTYGQRRPGEQSRPLELAADEVLDKVDFALPRMGVISGRVVDELGDPVIGVSVWALRPRYFEGRRRLVPAAGSVRTDITGHYRLLSLAPGEYVVMGATRETWPLDTDPKQVLGYAATYFPGTPAGESAQRIKVAAGRETPGIDLTLVPGRTSVVSGTAVGIAGLPLAGETVTLQQEIGGSTSLTGAPVASAKVAPDGTWTFADILPGEYRVSIRTPALGRQPAQQAHRTVAVAGADVSNVALVAGAGATVRGQVVTDDGSPLPADLEKMQVRPSFDPVNRAVTALPHPDNGRIRSDGSFEVTGVPRDAVLEVAPLLDGWSLKAIEIDGRDMADLPLAIEAGATISDVRIVLTNRPAAIRGAVRDDQLKPAEAVVLVFAEERTKWQVGSRRLRTTRPDQRGLFTFKGLPAGAYFLIALDYIEDGQWNDPEVLEELKARALRVTLADAESKQVDLVVKK
jgi:hypothetical protein